MFISWLHFVAMLFITGIFIRYVELQWPHTAIGKAFAVIY